MRVLVFVRPLSCLWRCGACCDGRINPHRLFDPSDNPRISIATGIDCECVCARAANLHT